MADDRHENDKARAQIDEVMPGEQEAAIAKQVAEQLHPLSLMSDYLGWAEVAEHIAAARAELIRLIAEKRGAADQGRAGGIGWQIH